MGEHRFLELLGSRIVFADGAMGTELYQHGVFLNTCFDELNLTRPRMVRAVHASYVEAGSDLVETNTFGANEYKLGKFGLVDQVEAINTQGVEIARDAAGDRVLVAGSVGPLGLQQVGLGQAIDENVRQAFARQIRALCDAGPDLLILETFSSPAELLLAIDAARSVCDLPLVAQLAVNENQETIYGNPLQESISRIAAEPQVAVVGLNCSIGPSAILESLKLARQVTDKPISVQPNAGLPREIEGRMMYMTTPEYMAEYAKRFFEHGARMIGGCCGTTPAHIREIVRAVRGMDRAMEQPPARVHVAAAAEAQPKGKPAKPLAEKSRLGAKLAAGESVCSIELVPPRGIDLTALQEKVRLCASYGVDAVNIPDGPRATCRLSPLVTAFKVQQADERIESILHVCCRDRNVIGMQSDMLGVEAMGVKNVLLVTGDPPKLGEYPDATAVFDLDSIALTAVVDNLNRGLDIAGNELSEPLSLTISVGANPVASDLPREIERYRRKVEAGAEYAITQPVFDAGMLLEFMDEVADCGIPIIAGIWPFTSYKNAEFMANEVPGVVVPQGLLDRMSRARTREEGRRIGVEIAREMMEQIGDRVAGYAVSAPFGNVRVALATLGRIGPDEI